MLNSVVLIGRLVADPVVRYTQQGNAAASLRLAVDRQFKNQKGERETDFIDVVAWKQTAELVAQYLTKGKLVAVQGRLQVRAYTAKDGSKRKSAEVVIDSFRMLDKAPRGDEAADASPGAPAAQGVLYYEDDPFLDE